MISTTIKTFLRNYWPILVLTLLEAIIFAASYIPGTFVVGWDNNFPEFNFPLNMTRTLTSVWQEYRGLGLEDGMSHAANLVHYLFLWVLSVFFPQHLLRYVFIFLMHLLGGVGFYILVKKFLTSLVSDKKILTWVSVISTLVFQYNFATVQMFYLPFEPFIIHFGFLPWLIYFVIQSLDTPNKKNVGLLAIFSLLATPMAHVPTVFLVYSLTIFCFLIAHLILKKTWKPVLTVVGITFCMNAFWGIPYIVSTINNASAIANSKNNQRATNEIYLKNHEFGDIKSVALLKSFSLEFVQLDHTNGQVDYMMKRWRDYQSSPFIEAIGWIFFVTVCSGIGTIIWKKQKNTYPLITLFIIAILIIGNDIPGIKQLTEGLRSSIPLIHTIFRFVYTKFFILYSLIYSLLFAFGLLGIIKLTKKIRLAGIVILVSSFSLLLISTFPSFQGNFIHPQLRVTIPQDYFSMFTFFQSKPSDGRIAVFPAPWYWSWTQYTWGVIGSGFQWFGIPQPILDRAFDPWSQHNENFYWESTLALSRGNEKEFIDILKKYQVEWLVIDQSILTHEKEAGMFTLDKLMRKEILSDSLVEDAHFGKIHIYSVANTDKPISGTSVVTRSPNIQPTYEVTDEDVALQVTPLYGTNVKAAPDIYFPFRSLFTGKLTADRIFTVKETPSSYEFTAPLSEELSEYTLTFPPLDPNILIDVNDESLEIKQHFPTVLFNEQPIYTLNEKNATHSMSFKLPSFNTGILTVSVPKVYGRYSYNSDAWDDFIRDAKSCDAFNTGIMQHAIRKENEREVLTLTSINSSNCIDFYLPFLSQRQGYIVSLDTVQKQGLPLIYSTTNLQTTRSIVDTYIDPFTKNQKQTSHYILPSLEPHSLGYTINIDNLSIGREQTINELHRVQVHQIPYSFLLSIKAQKLKDSIPISTNLTLSEIQRIDHPFPTLYKVIFRQPQSTTNTIILWQGYHSLWVGISRTNTFPYIQVLHNHQKINSWANGWEMNSSNTVYLFFLPQLLQWGGFVLLVIPIVFIKRITRIHHIHVQ